MLGDVVGQAGKRALFYNFENIKKKYKADFAIVNGENADDGFGLTAAIAGELLTLGIDVITSGNHIWQKEEIFAYLDASDRVLRPHNYPAPAPGKGTAVISCKGRKIAVLNLQGRVRMAHIVDCPFRTGLQQLKKLKKETPFVFVDFHAEDTAEREALALYFDGLATAVAGTHTHVATADETLLPQGTAHIGDLGMCGARESVIGSKVDISIERSLSQMPLKIESADGEAIISGAVITADDNGRALSIERISEKVF
jgi:metallophosphoesterase (TIGR00282 family)